MLYRTESIVLKSIPFGEADLIVTLLTLDYGLIKVFAKSPRKTGSRFGSSLEPLTHSRISYWGKENKDLPRLTQSDIMKNFQPLREELDCFLDILKIIELTLGIIPEREPHNEVFHLLLNTLNKVEGILENRGQWKTAILFYTIRLLDLSGFGPRLNGCARCNCSGLNFY
ncbi:MAG: DNA repair protein RecO, partial [Thermodesulfovibrionales bacterium]